MGSLIRRRCVIELYPLMNQCHPNKLNFKKQRITEEMGMVSGVFSSHPEERESERWDASAALDRERTAHTF